MSRLAVLLALVVLTPASARAGSICGVVRDVETTQPVQRAGIFLYQNGLYTGLHGATDSAGSYCVDDVPAGTYDLQVRVDDYVTAWVSGILVEDGPTAVDVATSGLFLAAPWPNPSSERVFLGFRVARSTDIELAIYDLRGRRVHSWQGVADEGTTVVPWNLRDGLGRRVASGSYLVRLVAGEQTLVRRLQCLQ